MRVINNLQSAAIGNKGEEKKNKTEHIRNESILNEEKDRRPRANTFAGVPSNAQSPLERTSLATPVKFIRFRFFVPPTCPIRSTEVIQTSDNERMTTHNGHLYQKFDTPDQNIQDNEPAIILSKTLVTDQKMSMEIEENKSMIRITIKNTSKSDKKVEFLITEEKFRSRSSSVSGGSNISIKLDNGLNCKIETKHSPASLPGTSSMQSLPSSTNEEFVEPNEVGVRRRQLNLANGGNKMPIKEPKVSHDSDPVRWKDKIRSFAMKHLFAQNIKKIFCCYCKQFMFLILFMIFVISITVYMYKSQDCKHSPASLPGTSSMQSPPSSTNEEFVEPNEVGVRRRQLNFANGGNKMPIKEPKVSPEHSTVDTVDFLRHQDAYKDRFVTVLAVSNFEHIDDHSLRGTNSWRSVNAIRDAFPNKNINVEIIHHNSLVEKKVFYYNSFVDAFVQEIEKDMGDTIEISCRYSKFDGKHHIVYHIVYQIVKISKLK